MKRFMKTCYKCNSVVKAATRVKDGINSNCSQCTKCWEEYFTSIELLKFDTENQLNLTSISFFNVDM